MSDNENVSVFDNSNAVRLHDVGGGAWELIEGIRGDGDRRYWLIDPDRAGERVIITPPPHEGAGPLPNDIQNRLDRMVFYWQYRCGVKTSTTGARCRKKVVSGGPCHLHRLGGDHA